MTKVKKIKYRPLFDNIITTAERNVWTASGILMANKMDGEAPLKNTQTVLRVGDNAPEYITVGSVVKFDMETFRKQRIPAKNGVGEDTFVVIPPLHEDEEGFEFMMVSPRNLLYVIEE
jgi:co-chaperonin GroES (HSP10)